MAHCTSARVRVKQIAAAFLLFVGLLALLAGCIGKPQLMPTPNVYSSGQKTPFLDVNPELCNNKVEVLYVTDRVPTTQAEGKTKYGFGRSRSAAYGIADVEFGHDVSWPDLVKASSNKKLRLKLPMTVAKTTEMGRFAQTPRPIYEMPGSKEAQDAADHQLMVEASFREALAARLALTPVKEVYLFVHGYNNNFNDAVTTSAELWHFLGREGVPMAFTWPAGRGGLLRGYTYDRESADFSVYHFKQMLKLIASCPQVQKINIIGHSRGTQVVASGLEELQLEFGSQPLTTRKKLKLGTLVLAAPDLDFDVVMQRMSTAHVGRIPERFAIYINSKDKALELSNWLFGGLKRLGDVESDMFTPRELDALRKLKNPQVIDSRVSDAPWLGHDYFHSSPSVSSDLILLMRYHDEPGAENGRPLGVNKTGFWLLQTGYPMKPSKNREGK